MISIDGIVNTLEKMQMSGAQVRTSNPTPCPGHPVTGNIWWLQTSVHYCVLHWTADGLATMKLWDRIACQLWCIQLHQQQRLHWCGQRCGAVHTAVESA
jgi:hypothetical protein